MARENILVVDDEPDMRDALTAALRREGLCISTAADGVEGLEKVQGQPFDLIITDVRMPRMGGLALLQEGDAARAGAASFFPGHYQGYSSETCSGLVE